MKKKSLTKNTIYNFIRNIASLMFPLITLPYISRILGVESIGRYNFAYTYVNYFLLIASLGVSGYAIREGARIRDDRKQVSIFLSQMYSINIICTLIACVLMFVTLLCFDSLSRYKELIYILGLILIFSPLSLTWLYTIFEDFLYITIRTVGFQIVSIFLLFVLVNDAKDVNMYAVITVVSNVGSNIFNYIHSKNYCDLKFTLQIDWRTHTKPVLIIFITSIAITIYVSSDMTILGLLCSDYNVGIYSVSVKVYTLLKNGLISVLSVMQARLAFYIGSGDKASFDDLSNEIINLIILIVLPIVVGIIALNEEIIVLLASEEFLIASSSMCILMIAVVFNLFAQFFNTCILMPYRQEKSIFLLSVGAAMLNVILNFLIIPLYKESGAAMTTVCAEILTFVIELYLIRRYMTYNTMVVNNILCSVVGCVFIVICSHIVHIFVNNYFIIVVLTILISILFYFVLQYILHNCFFISILKKRKVF